MVSGAGAAPRDQEVRRSYRHVERGLHLRRDPDAGGTAAWQERGRHAVQDLRALRNPNRGVVARVPPTA